MSFHGILFFPNKVRICKPAGFSVYDFQGAKLKINSLQCTGSFCDIILKANSSQAVIVEPRYEFRPAGVLEKGIEIADAGDMYFGSFSKTGYDYLTLVPLYGRSDADVHTVPSGSSSISNTSSSSETESGYYWTRELGCHPNDISINLAHEINDYREQTGKIRVPFSPVMFEVAHLHLRDLVENIPYSTGYEPCTPHSWSDKSADYGKTWTAICFPSSNRTTRQSQGMWYKPKEISGNNHFSFGIEIVGIEGDTSTDWVSSWASSQGHNDTMLEIGLADRSHWTAMGAARSDVHGIGIVWFGPDADPEAPLDICP